MTIVSWNPWNLWFLCFISWKNSFSDISRECILYQIWLGRLTDCTDRNGQFTPKMKANAVSRLLSSLVWIDHCNECNRLTALIIFGKMHFLLISQNEFTHEIRCNGMTSFMEFIGDLYKISGSPSRYNKSFTPADTQPCHNQIISCLWNSIAWTLANEERDGKKPIILHELKFALNLLTSLAE